MSNLGNQFISASYQSVLNVGTGSGDYVTSTLKPLTDGYGTAVPIKVSTTGVELSGSISLTGSLVSSIIPAVSNSIDLGSPTKPFRHLYVGSGSVYLDDHPILSLDTPGIDTTIAAPPSGTVQLLNDVVFSSQEGLGYEGAPGFTIVGGGTSFQSQTRYSGETVSYHTGAFFTTNYWVNNLNQITGDTSLELEQFKDNLKLATIENSRHLPTYYDSQYEINSIYEGTGSFNGVIRLKHTDLVNSEYSQIAIGDDFVQMSAGDLTGSSPIPKANFDVLENQVGGYFTNQASSASFTLTGSLFEVTGAIKATDGYIGNVQGTASFATSASYAPIPAGTVSGSAQIAALGFANTGSNTFNGSQTISGSLNVTGSITALSASITYLQTIYQTSSVIFTSGSNILGDEAGDVQTLNGTVNVPLGNLNITGATTASAGFFGNLQGTASFASNALSASQAQNAISASQSQNAVSASQSVNSDNAVSASQAQNAVSASQAQNAVSSSHSTYAANAGLLNNTGSGVFATTGSNNFFGKQYITVDDPGVNIGLEIQSGSGAQSQRIYFQTNEFGGNSQPTIFMSGVNSYLQSNGNFFVENIPGGVGSGSMSFTTNGDITFNSAGTGKTITIANVSGSVSLRPNVNVTGSLTLRSGSVTVSSNGTTVNINPLIGNPSNQSNIILGWNDSPPSSGPAATQANYTSSIAITGSNNIVSMPMIRATAFGGSNDLVGYISGSNNWINSNFAGIYMNTGSLLAPKLQCNIINNASNIRLNFTSSSLAAPALGNNILNGGSIIISHPSGSISAANNVIAGGQISSTQNFVTNLVPSISQNSVIGTVTLNHISSSITYGSNYNNGGITINNHLSSSGIAQNGLSVINNAFLGASGGNTHFIWASGSQSTNATRNIVDNLIGGRSNVISSSFVSSSNSNLVSTIVYGNTLTVSGSHTAGTSGGSAFFGRFNDTGSLASAQDIVFAVGTGTAAATRRTGLYVTSGSLVGVSGSFDVKGGDTTITGSLYVSGAAQFSVQNLNVGVSAGDEGGEILLAKAATNTTLTGSGVTIDVYKDRLRIFEQAGTNRGGYFAINEMAASAGSKLGPLNAGEFWSNTTQSGSAGVSGSLNFDASGSLAGVSLVSNSRLTVADAGTYNIQFSAQVETSAGADTAYVWFKKNGTNIADSATKVALANNTAQVMTVNILDTAAANDYYELAYQFTNGNATILSEAASGNVPRIPSVIATVTQIR